MKKNNFYLLIIKQYERCLKKTNMGSEYVQQTPCCSITFLMLNNLPRPYRVMVGSFTILSLVISLCRPYVYYRNSVSEVKIFALEKNKKKILTTEIKRFPNKELKNKTIFLQKKLNIKNHSKFYIIFFRYVILIKNKINNTLYHNVSHLFRINTDIGNLHFSKNCFWRIINRYCLQHLKWNFFCRGIFIDDYINCCVKINRNIQEKKKQEALIDVVPKKIIKNHFVHNMYYSKYTKTNVSSTTQLFHRITSYYRSKKDSENPFLILKNRLICKYNCCILVNRYLSRKNEKCCFIHINNRKLYNNTSDKKILSQGFSRFPTKKKFRVSSNFNLCRLNPITKRIAPHFGVDFAMPQGTPVLAVSDGEVVIAKHSVAAGYYVVIKHGKTYVTRYMHLYKVLVKPGQKVKWGDRIALSGNTGRSTGPHLHYEVWVNKQAVNPLTVKFPNIEGKKKRDHYEYFT